MRRKIKFYLLFLLIALFVCDQAPRIISKGGDLKTSANFTSWSSDNPSHRVPKGALLTTRFKSFEQLRQAVQIEYFILNHHATYEYLVRLTHHSNGREVTSVLQSGISEADFIRARDSGFFAKVDLALRSPYTAINKNNLQRIFFLGRRMHQKFTMGDVAFYDLAQTMFFNISAEDTARLPAADLTEKGFINTFNHLTGQAFMTTLFSERLADFSADAHELKRLPELITGEFSEKQLLDIDNGPVDNYIDLINNEWGQELGKVLKEKYKIGPQTHWTPELLQHYLNDVQTYYSWAFQISFRPYKATDEVVVRFSDKINRVMGDLSDLKD